MTYRKSDARSQPSDGLIPLLRATNITATLNLESDLVYVPTGVVKVQQCLRRGDVVVAASSGSVSVVGKSAPVKREWLGTFGAFCSTIRPKPVIDPDFLALFLSSDAVRRRWSAAARGTNINNLKSSDLLSTPVPLPSISEQRRIVDILDDHLSRLEAAGGSLQASLRRTQALDRSLLNHAIESLMEKGVPARTVNSLCETALGKMLDSKKAGGRPTPYLRNINVRWGTFALSDVKLVNLTEQERYAFAVKPGDLLVCEGGEPGRCAVWNHGEMKVAFQKALHRVRPRNTAATNIDYVALCLEQSIRSGRANRFFTGTTIRHLPQEKLRSIEIPFPGPVEQMRVVQTVQGQRESLDRFTAQARRAATSSSAIKRALLEAAFSGRLTGHSSDLDVAAQMAGI